LPEGVVEAIFRAALAGALGGSIGIAVAWLVSWMLRRRSKWLSLIPVGFAVFVVTLTRTDAAPVPTAAMATLDKLPTVQALKTRYPDDYRELGGEVRRATSAPQTVAVAEAMTGAVILRQRAKADPESAYAMYEVTRNEGRVLRAVDPAACATFMDGRSDDGRLGKLMTPAMIDKDYQAAAHLLAQTATTPAAPAKPMAMDDLLELSIEAIKIIPEQEQDAAILVLREMRQPRTPEEAKATCDFDLALADTILSRPEPIAGQLVRSLWAMK
jgi:hypothetical protein